MRILFFGDVLGSQAVGFLCRHVREWRAQLAADVVIANAENAAVTQLLDPGTAYGAEERDVVALLESGVDVLTGGNHSWDIPSAERVYDRPNVLRPHNMIAPTPGRGIFELTAGGERLVVVNLIGRSAVYGQLRARNELQVFDELDLPSGAHVFIDYHAEHVVEKRTFAHAVDGRALAVVGSHTHEPTLLLERFPRGTLFTGDAGMCGPRSRGRRHGAGVVRPPDARPRRTGVHDRDRSAPDRCDSRRQRGRFDDALSAVTPATSLAPGSGRPSI